MNIDQNSNIWKAQKFSDECKMIDCPEYDVYKDFKRDPSGIYVLIKINFEFLLIEVAVCSKDHDIVCILKGRKSQDIYNALFQYEKEHCLEWFKEKTHAAYLGKELKKAELALVMGNTGYFQE